MDLLPPISVSIYLSFYVSLLMYLYPQSFSLALINLTVKVLHNYVRPSTHTRPWNKAHLGHARALRLFIFRFSHLDKGALVSDYLFKTYSQRSLLIKKNIFGEREKGGSRELHDAGRDRGKRGGGG